jgi:hypothetical protein
MTIKVAWNKDMTASVVLAKVKEFTITKDENEKYVVRGWYNKLNSFLFGRFETLPQARQFLDDKIHNRM